MMREFDPDAPGVGGGIFGLPFTPEESEVVLVPVPWEATVSYGVGTVHGPRVIQRASLQLDLCDREVGEPYRRGIAMLEIPLEIHDLSNRARGKAERIVEEGGVEADASFRRFAAEVNELCDEMNAWVERTCAEWLDRGKLVGVVGGDHSVPFSLIRQLAKRHPGMGILHLDAHSDLREAYEGFTWSHASIMYNVLKRVPEVSRIVSTGVRDYSTREAALIEREKDRLAVFFDADLRARQQDGEPWSRLAGEIVEALPEEVYLSFDIDGLDPSLCPHTGTPVPGGLTFRESAALLRLVAESGRRIVGFDLSEVSPGAAGLHEWDANVGARLLYKMVGFALKTRPGK